jgi:hypothetical protein
VPRDTGNLLPKDCFACYLICDPENGSWLSAEPLVATTAEVGGRKGPMDVAARIYSPGIMTLNQPRPGSCRTTTPPTRWRCTRLRTSRFADWVPQRKGVGGNHSVEEVGSSDFNRSVARLGKW